MVQTESILEDSYKSPGVLNVGFLTYKFMYITKSKFIQLEEKLTVIWLL